MWSVMFCVLLFVLCLWCYLSHGTGPWEGAFNQQGRWTNYWWWFQNKQLFEAPKLLTHLAWSQGYLVQWLGSQVNIVQGLLVTNSLVTVYLSPVWVLAQCCLLTLAFSIWVTIPASTLSWLSITWHWPTKIYIHLSLSLMLPFNIGLPKTPHGLFLDRCHEPCPSVIPNTDQPRLQLRLLSLNLMLPQHQPNQDYCFLVSVMWVKLRQLHQMADSTNSSLGGCVIQWHYLWVIPKITGGFKVVAPFSTYSLCARFICCSWHSQGL